MAQSAGQGRSEGQKHVPYGHVHIKSTFNNTIISITDPDGDVLCWASAGTVNYEGTKKGTPFAAQRAAEDVARTARQYGLNRVDVYTKGPGAGRETAVRALQSLGLNVGEIKDVTPVPHNGCRAKKRRRV